MLEPKNAIKEMNGYTVPLYENNWDIKIDSNENNYGPSPKVIEAIQSSTIQDISFYPFYGELSQKIADFYGFNIENIKVTNGADEALQGIIQTYLNPKEALLTLDVSFEMPCIYTTIQDGEVIRVPFEKKWEFPIEAFLKSIENEKVKIIYISTPNNPTGSTIQENDLLKILEKANNKVIIIDETYANYTDKTYAKFVKEYDNVFITRSFSKDFALAGMRLGCVISNPNNIYNLKKVISPFSVNALAMKAGIEALNDYKYFISIKKEIDESKLELKNYFEKFGFNVYKSEANFLLIDAKNKAEFIYNQLKKENISIKFFKKGSPIENHIRITIPTKQGVERIKQALRLKPYLVFDMDGVLVDAKKSYRLAIEKTYEHFANKTISQEKIQKTKNLGGLNNDWDLTKFLLNKDGINVGYDDLVEVFQKFYWDDGKGFINNETPLFDKELFVKLSKDYNLAIFTGRLRNEAMFALEKFEAKDLFFPIITTSDIPQDKCKPDPYGINVVKEMTFSNQYYYLGDTIDDIKAGVGANCIAIGVLPPQDKSDELINALKRHNAQSVLQSVNEIEKILEQKCEKV